jgi:biopolymer transport protein ExbD
MRNSLTATCLLVFTQFAMAQSASPDPNTDVLTVRISADGACNFLDDSAPCGQLGKYLLTKHLAQNRHLHITVDRASKYELVAATLQSLEGTGFKVGFVNSEPSTKLNISEGNYIGYATVAEALAALKSQGTMALSALNDDVSFIEPDNKTTWTFAGKNNPAYTSAVKYIHTKNGAVSHVDFTILCEASDVACEKFRSDVRDNIAQISKMLAGDPSVKCWVGSTTKCGTEPVRKPTGQQVDVQLRDDGSCTIDSILTPCLDVGRKIRADHLSDDPKVVICASPNAKYDAVGKLLSAVADEHLPGAFGCPPH